MLLVLRRHRHAVDRAPDVAARQEVERVARVDRDRRVLRLHPLPLVRERVLDLQRGDGLAEEEREGAEVGVPEGPGLDLRVLLRGALAVLHVAEVVLGGVR